jgi:hypothetical protein
LLLLQLLKSLNRLLPLLAMLRLAMLLLQLKVELLLRAILKLLMEKLKPEKQQNLLMLLKNLLLPRLRIKRNNI